MFTPSPTFRHGARYEDVLHGAAAEAGDIQLDGHSGYFSKPGVGLDPRLFLAGSDRLRPEVRKTILKALYGFWGARYNHPVVWSRAWIAGSGVSHQWNAERGGVGDLDVLIGVDTREFLRLNPEFRGIPEALLAERFNKEFHDELWPQYAEHRFAAGQDPFEITFYVNPAAEDIRAISPYSAYDLTGDEWTVRPVELPEDWDPFEHFPQEWWDWARSRMAHGAELVERYGRQARELAAMQQRSPGWVNAAAALKNTIAQASAFFDDVHLGRKAAFSGGGKGYFGPENCLWQFGKLSGVIDSLRKIRSIHSQAVRGANEWLYGGQVTGHGESVTRASLAATKFGKNVNT